MKTDEQIYTYRITRKIRTGGSGCLAAACGLLGLILCIVLFPIGLVPGLFLLVAAVLVDEKTKHVSTCGHCGNEVSHASVLCPTCRADLAPEPKKFLGLFRRK